MTLRSNTSDILSAVSGDNRVSQSRGNGSGNSTAGISGDGAIYRPYLEPPRVLLIAKSASLPLMVLFTIARTVLLRMTPSSVDAGPDESARPTLIHTGALARWYVEEEISEPF